VAELSELSFTSRAFLAAYRWRTIDPVPWSPLRMPLGDCNVALVSTAGMVLPGQAPFDAEVRGGDVSFREIAADAQASTLIDTHRSKSFDHAGMHADPNLGFPIDRMRELASEGVIGRANRRHLSFMGSITAPGRLIGESAPAAAQLLVDDGVDAVLLVPV
jgi:D-proline reductase (dithiol) PrdB